MKDKTRNTLKNIDRVPFVLCGSICRRRSFCCVVRQGRHVREESRLTIVFVMSLLVVSFLANIPAFILQIAEGYEKLKAEKETEFESSYGSTKHRS
jgi:hypothetical protein